MSLVMRRTLISIAWFSLMTLPSFAGFINNKTQWDSLPADAKAVYAMGLFDESVTVLGLDHEVVSGIRNGKNSCAYNNDMSGPDLAELIDTMYRNDVALWSKPPQNVLHRGLLKMCNL